MKARAAPRSNVDVVAPATPEPTMSAAAAFHAHAGAVARFARRMGIAAADLDDLVQEVFLAAHARGGYRTGAASERSWYLRLAWYAVTGHRRRSRRAPQSLDVHEPVSDAGQLRTMEARERLAGVAAALETLSTHHRAALVLADVEGYSTDEIATTLEVPVGTVHSRLHHARKRFTEALQRVEAPRAEAAVAIAGRAP
jgi:RNA polymerase sigma-70 factor (ECF subfamily)